MRHAARPIPPRARRHRAAVRIRHERGHQGVSAGRALGPGSQRPHPFHRPHQRPAPFFSPAHNHAAHPAQRPRHTARAPRAHPRRRAAAASGRPRRQLQRTCACLSPPPPFFYAHTPTSRAVLPPVLRAPLTRAPHPQTMFAGMGIVAAGLLAFYFAQFRVQGKRTPVGAETHADVPTCAFPPPSLSLLSFCSDTVRCVCACACVCVRGCGWVGVQGS